MKTIKLVTFAFLALMVASCGEEKPKDVNVKLEMTVGDESLVQDKTYTISGVNMQFRNVAFYLGDMTFQISNSLNFNSNERYQLIRPGIYDYNFSIPVDDTDDAIDLSSITFFVGVDDATNAETEMDFTMRAADDPLGAQNPTMHWGWQGGYRFMNIDALADLDEDGEFETTLTYHLGKSPFLANISLSPNQQLEEGANDFRITFDLVKFLDGIDFNTEQFTKAQPDNMDIANKIYSNYSSAFTFE